MGRRSWDALGHNPWGRNFDDPVYAPVYRPRRQDVGEAIAKRTGLAGYFMPLDTPPQVDLVEYTPAPAAPQTENGSVGHRS